MANHIVVVECLELGVRLDEGEEATKFWAAEELEDTIQNPTD
jgi:hypothetical protein